MLTAKTSAPGGYYSGVLRPISGCVVLVANKLWLKRLLQSIVYASLYSVKINIIFVPLEFSLTDLIDTFI